MPKKIFEIRKWGPKKLREIHESIQNEINERTPLASETVDLNEQPDGLQICVKQTPGSSVGSDDSASGGGGGTPIAIYGAYNGAPALFHLLQSSAPTVPPP